jgi:pilus assembly protein Flp/PilA
VTNSSLTLYGPTNDRRGVTALEYALIAAVMGALVVTAVTTLGNSLDTAFTTIGTLLTTTATGM